MLDEILFCLLAALGMLLICWLILGWLLDFGRDENVVTICPVRGSGEGLEQVVLGQLWLRGTGPRCGRIAILDCGLTPEGCERARLLCRKEKNVLFCTEKDLPWLLKLES